MQPFLGGSRTVTSNFRPFVFNSFSKNLAASILCSSTFLIPFSFTILSAKITESLTSSTLTTFFAMSERQMPKAVIPA